MQFLPSLVQQIRIRNIEPPAFTGEFFVSMASKKKKKKKETRFRRK